MSGFDPQFDPAGSSGIRAGIVPAPGDIEGTSYFLAADRTWRIPSPAPPPPPPPPPGPDQDQYYCDLAGYLVYAVTRRIVKTMVDGIGLPLVTDAVAIVVQGLLDIFIAPVIVLGGPLTAAIADFAATYVAGHILSWTTAILSDVVWARIHCIVYQEVKSHPDIALGLAAAATVLTGSGVAPTEVVDGIALVLQNLGITTFLDIPLSAIEHHYDCSACTTTAGSTAGGSLTQGSFDLVVGDGTTEHGYIEQIDFPESTVSASGQVASVTPRRSTASLIGVNRPDNASIGVSAGVYSVLAGQLAMVSLLQVGSIVATSTAGVTISGLVVGKTYALQSVAGPWDPLGTGVYHSWTWQASVDGGATWQTVYAEDTVGPTAPTVTTPAWGASAALTDTHHARLVWVATTTSIRFRVGDSTYTDNLGTLGWQLLQVAFQGSSVLVEHNGAPVATRPALNFQDGTGITWSIADNALGDGVDIGASASGGTVTSVTASAPLASSGGATPNLSLTTPLAQQYGGTGIDTSAVVEAGILVGTSGHAWQIGSIGGGAGISVTETGGVITISATGSGAGGTALSLSSKARQTAATAASITVALGANSWSHLEIMLDSRGDNASNDVELLLRLNGDTAANYDSYFYYQQGTAAPATASSAGQTSMALGNLAAASAPAGKSGVTRIFLPNINGTDFHKKALWQSGETFGTTAATTTSEAGSGNWRNTSAITSITLFPSAGNFVTGTSIWVYAYA